MIVYYDFSHFLHFCIFRSYGRNFQYIMDEITIERLVFNYLILVSCSEMKQNIGKHKYVNKLEIRIVIVQLLYLTVLPQFR